MYAAHASLFHMMSEHAPDRLFDDSCTTRVFGHSCTHVLVSNLVTDLFVPVCFHNCNQAYCRQVPVSDSLSCHSALSE